MPKFVRKTPPLGRLATNWKRIILLQAVTAFGLLCIAAPALAGSIFATPGLSESSNGPGRNDSAVNDKTNSHRHTPLVRAVQRIRPSVVNIRGKKTVSDKLDPNSSAKATRLVNGMGTGVIIDSRGYILTNFHVVESVQRIEVTLHNSTTTTGKLLAVDPQTDLALLKIHASADLPVIPLGNSDDLMLAESVAAIGNAFGYEHTITRGIVSEIGRTVQVSNEQIYYNLIQTDAAINPGNSGGPLFNLDGEMVGINVAVRVGAQGIAFAIPTNDAMEVAADLIAQAGSSQVTPGFATRTEYQDNHTPVLVVESVDPDSSAAAAGLRAGDVIAKINSINCHRRVDLFCQLLDKAAGDPLTVELVSDATPLRIDLSGEPSAERLDIAWEKLGLQLQPIERLPLESARTNYRQGLLVRSIQPNSAAYRRGIRTGDIIVAMDGWVTQSLDNVQFVLNQSHVANGQEFEFYLIRGASPLKGNLRINASPQATVARTK